MIVQIAQARDAESIAALVNSAYRGETSRFGWTTEADYLEGSRISADSVTEMIASADSKAILIMREREDAPPIGCVYLENFSTVCYLGMLTISPKLQDRGLGRLMLQHAEIFARDQGAALMTLGVIQLRGTLMAWYERRGYRRTDTTKPFPYDQPEAGIPKRDDLHFIMFEKKLTQSDDTPPGAGVLG